MNKTIFYTLIATTLFIQTRNNYAAEVNQPAINDGYTRPLIVHAKNGDSLELSPADLIALQSEYLKQLVAPEHELSVESIAVLPIATVHPLKLLLPRSQLARARYDDVVEATSLADLLMIPNGVDRFLKRLGRENIKLLCQLYQDPGLEGRELVKDYIIPYIPYKPTRQLGEVDNGNLDAGHNYVSYSIALSSDGNTIISDSEDYTLIVWRRGEDGLFHMAQRFDVIGNTVDHPHIGHTDPISSIALSADSNTIISGSEDYTAIIWHRGEDGLFHMAQRLGAVGNTVDHPHIGHTYSISSIALSADGNTIISGSKDHTAIIWHRGEDGLFHMAQRLGAVNNENDLDVGHTDCVRSVALSSDGNMIVSASDDCTAIVWQRGVDGQFHNAQRLGVIDVTDQGLSYNIDPARGHTSWVYAVALSPDGNTIVTGSADRTAIVWHRGEDGLFHMAQRLGAVGSTGGHPNVGHTGSVNSIALSPDGNTIISGSGDRTLIVWRRGEDGRFRFNSQRDKLGVVRNIDPAVGHTNWVESIALSSDGNTIISSSADHTVILWQRQSVDEFCVAQIANSVPQASEVGV